MQIISIVFIIFLGYSFISLLNVNDMKNIEKYALGFLLGNSIYTYILFLANLKGISFSEYNLSIILAFLCIVIAIIGHILKNLRKINTEYINNWSDQIISKFQIYGKLYLAIIFIIVLVSSLYSPVKDWDSLVLYDFRAKTFVETGYMYDGISKGYFFGYPLLSSLSHTWAYLFGFSYPTIVHGLYFISFIIFYGYLMRRMNLNNTNVLITQILIASLPRFFGHAFMTYTNLMYSVYLISSFLYLSIWAVSRSKKDLFISAMLLTSASWTRINEPFWMSAIIFVIIYSFISKKLYLPILYYLPNKLLQNSWFNFEIQNSSPRVTTESAMGGYLKLLLSNTNISQVLLVGNYVYDNVLKADIYLYIIIICLLFSSLLLKNNKYIPKLNAHIYPILLIIIFNIGIVFAGTYVFSLSYPTWDQIGDSASRMSMFITPMLVTVILIIFDSIFSSKKYDSK